jgi:ferredoxin
MKAIVDPHKCIGCTACATECPAVFSMVVDEDLAVAISGVIPPSELKKARDAAEICPAEAIKII